MPRNGIKIVGSSLYPLILSRFNEFLLAIGSNGFVSMIRARGFVENDLARNQVEINR